MVLEKYFKLSEHNTNVKTEVVAGITTFMTMGYIIMVNPGILSATGMDFGALITTTCIASAFATIFMALYANYPFALAPGMGLNAFFAFGVVLGGLQISWQAALAAVFINGIIFLLLTLTTAREALFNAIPMNLKLATSVGIGLFIAFIGFTQAGIVVADPDTYLTIGNFHDPGVLLSLFGLVVAGLLLARGVKGALLISILSTSVVGMVFGIVPWPEGIVSPPPSISPIFMKMDFKAVLNVGLIPIIFTFTFVDLFDTMGTLVGVASKAKMLDKDGKLPRINRALGVDAVGTIAGAALGTSTVTTYVESASGVAEGGKTGLTSLVTGVLFLLALFFSPIVAAIPGQATAPALILVGLFMMEPVLKIDLSDYTEAIPAFLTIILMPLTYSIAEGLVMGVLSYVVIKLVSGRYKDVSPVMLILGIFFVIRFIFFV
ncbi:MAG: NCS2 family permease [Bacillota bacterium]|jgi:AGZA family xanthine/uracil permease-like MFS transporter|nr:NCS2 family permease [Bacillota bacterium]MDD3298618.1 NCS2 family permease [Bacillota bacterium]MDD3851119.1 NCS2 family permease [Bacillota bacterium]MDD4707575.1 NCS2 family permease [Bacillota bacterium]